jgi:hypothetical protein
MDGTRCAAAPHEPPCTARLWARSPATAWTNRTTPSTGAPS